ncbi:MAG: DNA cytosine methyltransferase [Planctomycetota bacterium]
MTAPAPTFAEFFAGIGLMRLGLESAGGAVGQAAWRCAFATDYCGDKRAMYARHFGDTPDGQDVHTLSEDAVPTVDLATASFPCTDLSLAGGRAGLHRGESSAFWGFHRVLSEMQERMPRAVLLENVPGLITSNRGGDFLGLLQAMNDLGYAVDPVVIDARGFVPQSRARLFVVCVRAQEGPQDRVAGSGASGVSGGDPFATPRGAALWPTRLRAFIETHRDDVAWNCPAMPDPPADSGTRIDDILKDPPDNDPAWWSAARTAYLYQQMYPRHQTWIEERRNANEFAYATAFRRVRAVHPKDGGDGSKRSMAELRTDGIAGCLRTPKGGSARQIVVRVGRGRFDARHLSGRECAALMGARDYKLEGSESKALFGFGDAVCVPAVAWLAEHHAGLRDITAKAADSKRPAGTSVDPTITRTMLSAKAPLKATDFA